MWHWLLEWRAKLTPGTIRETYEVVRDLVSIGIGALGVFLAYLAIRLGKEQAKIARRQAEISELQHRLVLTQLSRRPRLEISFDTNLNDELFYTACRVLVHNFGNKAIERFRWYIWLGDKVGFEVRDPVTMEVIPPTQFADCVAYYEGICTVPVLFGTEMHLVTITAETKEFKRRLESSLECQVRSDEGRAASKAVLWIDGADEFPQIEIREESTIESVSSVDNLSTGR